ncbi:hypothetical protein ACFSBZ_08930 [Amnibacterium flavum]|uniref:Uncharacterized protein n=1 Tax=Amnibacterium flavum TaxID=2173173 RepID=A0A2V1HTI4_9MICO|nr:hypothetical protein [Amnibacterium flavum]PVZ94992.1 hypothetical protein DDQ50_00170 [Amnibacterium flavum]
MQRLLARPPILKSTLTGAAIAFALALFATSPAHAAGTVSALPDVPTSAGFCEHGPDDSSWLAAGAEGHWQTDSSGLSYVLDEGSTFDTAIDTAGGRLSDTGDSISWTYSQADCATAPAQTPSTEPSPAAPAAAAPTPSETVATPAAAPAAVPSPVTPRPAAQQTESFANPTPAKVTAAPAADSARIPATTAQADPAVEPETGGGGLIGPGAFSDSFRAAQTIGIVIVGLAGVSAGSLGFAFLFGRVLSRRDS